MFKGLRETIKGLNSDINNVANSEKAKNLRKKLLKIGLPIAIVGFLGVFICFALFATAGLGASQARRMIPFILIIPCAIVGGFGSWVASIGFKIAVTGYTTNLIDEAVGNNCPNCHTRAEEGKAFCPRCGHQLNKQCANCGFVNHFKNQHCEKCGRKL